MLNRNELHEQIQIPLNRQPTIRNKIKNVQKKIMLNLFLVFRFDLLCFTVLNVDRSPWMPIAKACQKRIFFYFPFPSSFSFLSFWIILFISRKKILFVFVFKTRWESTRFQLYFISLFPHQFIRKMELFTNATAIYFSVPFWFSVILSLSLLRV